MSLTWFRSLLLRQSNNLRSNRRGSRKPFRTRKLYLEFLEDRTLLSGTTWYVDASDSGNLIQNGSQANPYGTISQAVTNASAGDTIEVAAGTYSESVNVNKSLTVLGAQAGVDARTRSGAESIVDGTNSGGETPFYVTSSDVTIDGFTIQGANSSNYSGYGILLATGTSGAHIVNDIIQSNSIGIGLANANATDQAVIQYNLIENNNAPGAPSGFGIYTDQYVARGTVSDVLLDSNTFSGNLNAGIVFGSQDDTEPDTGITISNNLFNGDGQGMYAFSLTSSSITGNTFENAIRTVYGDIQLFEGTSQVSITGNLMENGGSYALEISNAATGAPAATGVTYSENSVSGYNSGGVAVSIDASGDYNGTLDVSGNWWNTAIGANPTDPTAPNAINSLVSDGVTVGSFLNSGANIASGNGFTAAVTTEMWVPETAATSGLTHVNGVIQSGINTAVSGMTVRVAADTYNESPLINKSLTLQGAGMGLTTIDLLSADAAPTYLGSLFVTGVGTNATINGFTLVGADAVGSGLANTNIYLDYSGLGTVTISDNDFKVGNRGSGSNGDDGFGILNAITTTPSQFVNQLNVTDNDFEAADRTPGYGAFFINSGATNFLFDSNHINGNFANASYTSANSSTISNNVYAGGSMDLGGFGTFAYPDSTYGATSFTHNQISNTATAITDDGSNNVTLSGNQFSNNNTAFTVNTTTFFGSDVSAFNPATLSVTGNTFTGNAYDVAYIDATSPTDEFSVTGNTFDGVTLNASTPLADIFAIQSKILDKIDVPDGGLVRLEANNIYVTPTSYYSGSVFIDGSPYYADGVTPVADPTTSASIQRGIDAASSGDTVNVEAGTYIEDLVINKSLVLAGTGQGNTIILPSVADVDSSGQGSEIGSSTSVIVVQSDNVTIHDLTVDGNNPALAGSPGSAVVGGINVDARNGIIMDYQTGTYQNLVVYNTTVQNIFERGIEVTGENFGSTFNIHNNFVQNVQGDGGSIGIFNYGGSGTFEQNDVNEANDAISANWSEGTQFLDNTITNSGSGIHTDNNGGAGGVADTISGNNVSLGTPGAYGIWVFVPYLDVSVQNNIISGIGVGLAAFGGSGGSATFTDNQVTGIAGGYGAIVTDDQLGYDTGSVSATFTGNTLSGGAVGLYVEQILDNNTPSSTTTVIANGTNIITNNTTAGVQMIGGSVTLTQNTIQNNAIGIQVDGGTLTSATQNSLANNTGDGLQVGSQASTGIFSESYAQNVTTTGAIGAFSQNDVCGNGGYGINNQTSNLISAEQNYWGAATGPTISSNPTGTGDAINGNVNYSPFATNNTYTAFALAVAPPANQESQVNVSAAINLGSFLDTLAGDNSWSVDVNWGDGSTDTTFNTTSTGSLGSQNHTYTTANTYTVTVTVTNNNAVAGTSTFQINDQPTAGISGPSDGVLYQSRTFTFSASNTPSDDAAGYSYNINWGDGNTQTVSATPNNTSITVSHTYTGTGTYAVSATATDQYNNTSAPVNQLITIGLAEVQSDSNGQGGITGLAIAGVGGSGVVLTPVGTSNSLTVVWNGTNLGTFAGFGTNVQIYGDNTGTDLVTVNGTNPPSSGADSYTISGNTVTFNATGYSNPFTIGLNNNTFSQITLKGGPNGNTFTDSGASVNAVFVGGAGNDTYTFNGATMGSNTTIQDSGGSNKLYGPNLINTWIINGTNAGSLNGVCTFSGVQNLYGGSSDDLFRFSGAGKVGGAVNGGSAGNDTLDYTNYTGGAVAVNLAAHTATATGSFANILNFIGHAPLSSTLVGPNTTNSWSLSGANSGTLNATYTFTNFGNLTGGTGADTFTVGSSGSLVGTLKGGSGANTLVGPNFVSTFTITASNTGNLQANSATVIPTFMGISNLTGGSAANTFVFKRGVGITGSLNGGTGGGTLDYTAYTTNVSVNLGNHKATGVGGTAINLVEAVGGSGTGNTLTGANTANTWNLTANNAGNLNGTFTFIAFANLTGGGGDDDFVFSDQQGVTGTINGGSGTNTLDYSTYSTGVYVNMYTGTATNTHAIKNILQVYGSGQGDVLVGNGTGVKLVETMGDNLLIGGTGKATIDSGSGEDIVIAGSTSYDSNATALQTIEAYWKDQTNSESTRISTLLTTGTPSGNYKLNRNTVTHASASDTLVLGAGSNDWVFYRLTGSDSDTLTGTGTPFYVSYI